ncbi:MAG: uroporphyrinogen-III synthase, partial [Planctomycetota bacterium]|nr:uroporphyrinogen-III synthase [Planctomycetota bacterium]
ARAGTACFYMGVSRAAEICAGLTKYMSADTPAAAISDATLPSQRVAVGTLRDLPERMVRAGISAPAIIVVGDVVRLAGRLGWVERRPLHGRTVIVTRAAEDAPRTAAAFEALGARALCLPTIRIGPPGDPAPLARAAERLADFDWVILTSVHGVDAVFGALERAGLDARAFGRAKVAAIGPATARALARRGIRPDIVPPVYTSEALLAEFRRLGLAAGNRFLLARADIAGSALADGLRAAGASVTEAIAYRTVAETEGGQEALAALDAGSAHWAIFTSASTARFFASRIGDTRIDRLRKGEPPLAASIGPATSAALRELGIEPSVEAVEHTIEGLVEAVLKAENRAGRSKASPA